MGQNNGHPNCESCGEPLVESRKFFGSNKVYWNRPWGSTLKMSVPIIPHVCMHCGRVYLFLGDRNKIIREFTSLPDKDKDFMLKE
jgi:hypothetical protein